MQFPSEAFILIVSPYPFTDDNQVIPHFKVQKRLNLKIGAKEPELTMRIEIPHETERLGAVLIHSVQKVFELDTGLSCESDEMDNRASVMQRIPYDLLN